MAENVLLWVWVMTGLTVCTIPQYFCNQPYDMRADSTGDLRLALVSAQAPDFGVYAPGAQ
ncbi:hypothetical protein BC834DRAFT_856744 [Gloeopeniophorella convolvens]|nr:hypothetical protein BC834DRAFT_856744 [Gloeopeniophorella convolvens]